MNDELTIVGWPGIALPLPVHARWRYRLDEEGTVRGEPLPRVTKAPPGDTCLRLAELDLEDPEAVLQFLNHVGAPVDLLSTSHTLEDVARLVQPVRDAVTAWRVLAGDPPPTDAELAATGFVGHEEPQLRRHAAELLSTTLAQALRPLHPVVWLGYGPQDPELASARDISLATLCFAEIHRHVVDRASYRRCLNESCGRLFAADAAEAKSGRRRSLYCSRACAHAQAQREFRRRRAQSSAPS